MWSLQIALKRAHVLQSASVPAVVPLPQKVCKAAGDISNLPVLLCFVLFYGLAEAHYWHQKPISGGWRDGSEVKSTGCSSRGPEFNSQQLYAGSQPSIVRPGTLFWSTGINADRTL